MKKQIISLLTALALSLSLFPVWAGAAGTDGTLCPHHPAHDGDCGFAAPSEGHPCGHTHTAACYTNGQLPGGADYETGPDAQELLNCPHVHDAACGFAEPNGGADCGFVCHVCPVEALIARLPDEVTPDNAETVRAQLDEILVLFTALDADEQGQIDVSDISRCTELQAALDAANVAAPVSIANLDLSNATSAEDTTNHYKWEAKKEDSSDTNKITSGTLTLSDGFQATKVTIPDATVTIKTTGECTISELYADDGMPDNTQLTISGTGKLTITNRINICGGHNNGLTVEKGATLCANGGIGIGADACVDSVVTVKGKLDVSISGEGSAMSVGKVVVDTTGELNVSGEYGVNLNGMADGNSKFSNLFVITGNGQFTANCSKSNLTAAGPFPSGTNATDVIFIPDAYMPYDCVQQMNPSSNAIHLYRISSLNDQTIEDKFKDDPDGPEKDEKIDIARRYTGPMYIHLNHNFKSSWESDANNHWHACNFTGCTTRENNEAHNSTWASDDTNHWKECSVCGYKTMTEASHTWESTPSSSGGYEIKCSVCGRPKNSVTVTVSIPNVPLTYGKTGTVKPECKTNPAMEFTRQQWELKENGKDGIIPMGTDGLLPDKLSAGEYTLKCTGTTTDNVTLQGSTTFKVNPAPLTVASVTAEGRPYDGTNTVNITGGTLNGIVNSDDVSVNTTDLKGTLNSSDAGDYTSVTLSSPTLTGTAKANYILTQTGTVPTAVTISKASARTPRTGNLEVVNNRAHTYSYNLGALLPALPSNQNYGDITCTLGEVDLRADYYTGGIEIGKDGETLTLPIQGVTTEEEKEIGTIPVTIVTRNFEDMTATIHVQSVNKSIPTGQPILTPKTLTYGQSLNSITLSGSMKDGETDVPGTFEWVDYSIRPDVQEAYPASWKFSPDDTGRYISVDGTSNIKVLPLSIEGAEITLTPEYFTYDGEAHKPEITSVKLNGNLLTADKDYTADIPEGREINTYTVTLTGTGNYTGTATRVFHINRMISLNQKDKDGNDLYLELEPDVSKVPDNLVGKFDSPDAIKRELRVQIKWVDSDVTAKIEFYDVELQYKDKDGNWQKVDPENFPEGGLTVILPYPPGTGKTGFDFEISHMLTADSPDGKLSAGDVETVECTPTDDGLECLFTSLSPVAIAYRAASPKPAPSGGGGGGGSSSRTHPVKTEQSDHGSITAAPSSASPGATITLTVSPDSGYRLDTLTVTDAGGKSVKLTARPDGTYTFLMPNSAVTVTASFTSGDPEETCSRGRDCPSLKFSDLGGIGTWYHEAVDYVLLNALMSGYGNGSFGPNDNVTRAQFAQILYNRAGHPAVTGPSGFTDVLPGAWYAPAVTWAAGQGVVLGYGNGLFGPDDSITREQLAAMLWRYAGRPVATQKELHFSDADKISPYALDALCWAVENGIVNGMGNNILSPQGLATRAQVAQMLMNYLENT